MIGGYVADRWVSPRILVPIGEVLMGLGYLMAWKATGKGSLILMIILVSVGTGLFKGNVSGINGRQFDAEDSGNLNAIFSVQYSFVNIGALIGTMGLALIATQGPGYRALFFVCGILMFVDCLWWLLGVRFIIKDAGKKPFQHDDNREEAVAGNKTEEKEPLTKAEKKRVAAILIVTAFSGVFWLIWYMAYLPVYYKFGPVAQAGEGWANWKIGGFEMPTSYFDSTNSLLCIILCPVFAAIWLKMSNRAKGDWSMWQKTATGIILLGVCIVCMVIAAVMAKEGKGNPVGIWIIVLVSIFMTVGEVIFSPLGNAFISEYSPKRILGTLMGVWPVAIFFAGLAYGPLYAYLSKFSFVKAYGVLAVIILIFGVVMLAFNKKFEKLIADEDE